jgi:hypothetical protein
MREWVEGDRESTPPSSVPRPRRGIDRFPCVHRGEMVPLPLAPEVDTELLRSGVKLPTCNGKSNVYPCASTAVGSRFTNFAKCWGCKHREEVSL